MLNVYSYIYELMLRGLQDNSPYSDSVCSRLLSREIWNIARGRLKVTNKMAEHGRLAVIMLWATY